MAKFGARFVAIYTYSEVIEFNADFGFADDALAALAFPVGPVHGARRVKVFAVGSEVAFNVTGRPSTGPGANGRLNLFV